MYQGSELVDGPAIATDGQSIAPPASPAQSLTPVVTATDGLATTDSLTASDTTAEIEEALVAKEGGPLSENAIVLEGTLVMDSSEKEWLLIDPETQPYKIKLADESTFDVKALN